VGAWRRREDGEDHHAARGPRRRNAARRCAALARTDRGGATLAAGLLTLAVVAILGLVLYRLFFGGASDPATAARSVVTYSQPVVSLGADLHPFWKGLIEDVVSRLGFAAVVLLAGLSYTSWRHETKGRLARQTAETNLIEQFAFTTDPAWFRSVDARAAFDRLKRLRLFDTDLIDVPRTVAKAVRAGGAPIEIVRKQQREPPNYVLLVDRAGRDDLEGVFANAVEVALIEARIVYSRYDFSDGLDRLNPVRRGFRRGEHGSDVLSKDIVDAEYLPFSVIASRHAGERLILIGTGTGFFETPGLRYDSEGNETLVRAGTPLPVTAHLREFSVAALITPSPITAWGDNERHLGSRLGIEVFFSDVGGISDLAARLMSEPGALAWTAPREQTDEDRFLAWLDGNSMRLTSQMPPPGAEIDRLVRNLKAWAGEPKLYTLLAAIAAFPQIDPAFTFVLADMVLGEKKLDSALFARLVRLPWIRAGYMPDWLRIALVNALAPQQRKDVRTALLALLKGIDQADQEGRPTSRAQLLANLEVARELPRGTLDALLARMSPRNVLSADERIFFSVLRDNYRLDPERDVIEPEAPEIVAAMIDAPERQRRAQIRLVVIGLAALAALLQPWIWTALTAAGRVVVAALGRLTGILPAFWSPPAMQAFCVIAALYALVHWYVVIRRDTPAASKQTTGRGSVLRRWLNAPQVPAIYCTGFALFSFMARQPDGEIAYANFVTSLMLVLAGIAVLAWVLFVTPQRWWSTASADNALALQVARDPVTGTLGTGLVVAIWAVPWLLMVLPTGVNTGVTAATLFSGACIGVISWVASAALARRWLIGEAANGQIQRLWLDAAFALTTFLVLSPPLRLVALVEGKRLASLLMVVVAPAVYGTHLKATLGLRGSDAIWAGLINGAIAGVAVGAVVFSVTVLMDLFVSSSDLSTAGSVLIAGMASGAVIALQSRRPDHAVAASMPSWVNCVVLNSILFVVAALALGLLETIPFGPLKLVTRAVGPKTFLLSTILPAAFAIWPMFRVLARSRILVAPQPRWRAVVNSPYWATLAMWLTGLVWQVGGVSFSLWPLMLPIAIVYALRHQERALIPLALGTLPLIVQIGDINARLYTPGGVWSALAILLLARFSADAAFRARVLRREHLLWVEAIVIIALLSVQFDLPLGRWGENFEPFQLLGRTFPARLSSGFPVTLHVDPSFMLAAVAAVLGASRMPVVSFVAVAVIAAWLAPVDAAGGSGAAARAWVSIGLQPGEAMSVLLVLFGAQVWRTYAASGVGLSPLDRATGEVDARLTRMKNRGVWLSYAVVALIAASASGFVPAINLDRPLRIAWTFVPDTAATLTLVLLTGFVAGNLWTDRVVWAGRGITQQLTLFLDRALSWMPRFAATTLGAAFIFLGVAQYGEQTLKAVGIGTVATEAIPRGLGAIGFAACVVVYLLFGVALRILAESDGRSWTLTACRLWRIPKTHDPPRRMWPSLAGSAQPDPPPITQAQPPPEPDAPHASAPSAEPNALQATARILDEFPDPRRDPTAHELLRIMAGLYSSESATMRFVARYGIDEIYIKTGLAPIDRWQDLLEGLAKTGKLRAAVEAARSEFSGDSRVRFLDKLLTTPASIIS
jgi:hypothetical protein